MRDDPNNAPQAIKLHISGSLDRLATAPVIRKLEVIIVNFEPPKLSNIYYKSSLKK